MIPSHIPARRAIRVGSPRPPDGPAERCRALSPAMRLLCTWAIVLSGGVSAAQDFGPVGSPWQVNENVGFTQEWGRVVTDARCDRIGFVWETVLGHEVQTRLFDGDGVALTSESQVNATLTTHIQDEPGVAMDADGNMLVAWSDRAGYDGDMMGIFARLYDANGAPVTPEFQVNVEWLESQWEPLVASMPDGRWLVAYSGRSNGDAFFRIFDAAGAPVTGDVQINTFTGNAQIDTAPAIARDGTILVTFVDFSGAGTGDGQTVFGRRYAPDGTPLDPNEWQVHATLVAGDQREPRVCANGLLGINGRFVVAWEDHAVDGSGSAIVARMFDTLGTPRGPEFVVNQTTADDQQSVALASDWVGNFVLAWEDHSPGDSRIVGRRYDLQAQPLGDEFVIKASTLGNVRLPSIALDRAGEDFVFAYTAPYEGPERGPSTQSDIYAQRYAFEPIKLADPPILGTTFEIDLHFPGGVGLFHILLASFVTTPGIALPDGRELALFPDILFDLTLAEPDGGVFGNFQNFLGVGATQTATVSLPNSPAFVGLTFNLAAVTVNATAPELIDQLRHVTDPIVIELQ